MISPKKLGSKSNCNSRSKGLKLFSSWRTHKVVNDLWNDLQDNDEYKNNLLKNKKDVTLRTKENHSSKSSSDDDDFELLTRKFKMLMKQESKNKNKFKKDTITCYKYKRPRHFKSMYQQLKKKMLT